MCDAFYVEKGGFDTHNDLDIEEGFGSVNTALESFVAEMKAQGVWENVTVVCVSEFGRALKANGAGTDHGVSNPF